MYHVPCELKWPAQIINFTWVPPNSLKHATCMFCKLSLILIFDMWLILSLLHLQGRDFSAFIVWYVVQIKETCFSEAISAWKHIFIILGIFSFHWTKHLLKTFHIFGKASLLLFSVVLLNQARLPQPLVFILILILILIPTLYKIRTLLTGAFCTP